MSSMHLWVPTGQACILVLACLQNDTGFNRMLTMYVRCVGGDLNIAYVIYVYSR
jgi:hypothetical protein